MKSLKAPVVYLNIQTVLNCQKRVMKGYQVQGVKLQSFVCEQIRMNLQQACELLKVGICEKALRRHA
jgi:hypothetical protein